MKRIALDYGRCPCSGMYENRTVEVRMTVAGRVILLTDVPQGACPLCGSRVYKTEVLERIESVMKQPQHYPKSE
jgi:YgiT-type zinc finger domain-containing protein